MSSPKLTVASIVGARPQFVKASALSPALRSSGVTEILIHTGQHYDWEMSAAFFEDLNIPAPDFNLNVGSAPQGTQTGRMMEALEEVLCTVRPQFIVVFGDTNSTLAAALVGSKLHIPVAHIEAGLRSFDRRMPEEINRIVTDHVSTLLFAPTAVAVSNLSDEGIRKGVFQVGDVMWDVASKYRGAIASTVPQACAELDVTPGNYALVTVHRAENTDDPTRWAAIVAAIKSVAQRVPVVWPVHPRTREMVRPVLWNSDVRLIVPTGYLRTQALVAGSKVVLTDSGGLQKEAAFHHVPCVTMRDSTEWTELVELGVNVLAGADTAKIINAFEGAKWPQGGIPATTYGNGQTANTVASLIAVQAQGHLDPESTGAAAQ